jgi:hypothetical protein
LVEVDNISYIDGRQFIPLRNGDFSSGLASWFPAGQSYFVPWHIDNVYLEILIERGLLSVVLSALGIGMVLWRLVLGSAKYRPMSPYWAASVSGVLVVGLVSSVLDVPRVAFLAMLMLLLANREARYSARERASPQADRIFDDKTIDFAKTGSTEILKMKAGE